MDIGRHQVEELLKSLEEFGPMPRAGLDLAATVASNSQRAQTEAGRRFSTLLTVNENGVKALARLLSAMHTAMLPSRISRLLGTRISFPSSLLIANTFGAFLGEALRVRVGGEWRLVDFNGQTLAALYFDKHNWTLPIYKAGKHFMNGEEDDVEFFYSTMVKKRTGRGIEPIITVSGGIIHDHRTGEKRPL